MIRVFVRVCMSGCPRSRAYAAIAPNRQLACFPIHSLLHLCPATKSPSTEIPMRERLHRIGCPPHSASPLCATRRPHPAPRHGRRHAAPTPPLRTLSTPAWLTSQTSSVARGTTMTTSSGRSSTRTSLAGTSTSACGHSWRRGALLC